MSSHNCVLITCLILTNRAIPISVPTAMPEQDRTRCFDHYVVARLKNTVLLLHSFATLSLSLKVYTSRCRGKYIVFRLLHFTVMYCQRPRVGRT